MPRTHLPNILYCYFLLSSYYYSFIFPHILFINLPSFSFLFMCMVKLIPEAFAVHSDIKMHWQLIRACLENTQFPEGAADSLTWLAAMNHDFFFLFVCFQGQPDEIALIKAKLQKTKYFILKCFTMYGVWERLVPLCFLSKTDLSLESVVLFYHSSAASMAIKVM